MSKPIIQKRSYPKLKSQLISHNHQPESEESLTGRSR